MGSQSSLDGESGACWTVMSRLDLIGRLSFELSQSDAVFAARSATGTDYFVLRSNLLSRLAVVVVVIDLPQMGSIFR
jgi:hypothetical protein